MRFVVADRRPLVVEGLRASLAGRPEQLAGAVSSFPELVRAVEDTRPDLVAVAAPLWFESAAPRRVVRALRASSPGLVVVVVGRTDPQRARDALEGGADAYVAETLEPHALARILTEIHAGTVFHVPPRDGPRPVELSRREQEVLAQAGRGRSTREIADALRIRPATVKSHLARIYLKLGAPGRAAAVARASGDSEDSPMETLQLVSTVALMWDVLTWHNGTLSIAWWAVVVLVVAALVVGGGSAAKR